MCCPASLPSCLTTRTLVLHLIYVFLRDVVKITPHLTVSCLFSGAFHIYFQVWVHNVGLDSLVYPIEQICDDSGEDPTCSRSLSLSHIKVLSSLWIFCQLMNVALPSRSVSGNSVQDHIHYLGISMHSESRGSCRIVTDDHMLRYRTGTADGAIILSKQPGLSVDQQLSAQ